MNQIFIDGLANILTRIFDFKTAEWIEGKLTIGELRASIANLKDDLTNSQVNKVITSSRQSTAALDAKKRKITFEQLAKHNTKAHCWMCVQGVVYDITDYVAKHPGGKIILEGAGKDATNLFSSLY